MNINWDAKGYKENFSFVHEYGEDVVSLLKSPKGAAVPVSYTHLTLPTN